MSKKISELTATTEPTNNDAMPIVNSSTTKKVTLGTIKTFIQTAFASVFAALSHTHTQSDITDFPSVPTKTSDLTNDSGFITNSVNDLTNYYLKSETYTKTEVNNLLANINSFSVEVVQTLPTENIDTHTIYLVPKTGETSDNYDEYIYINNAWEHIGSTTVDLSNYYTKTEADNLLSAKQNTLTFDDTPTANSTNPVKSGGIKTYVDTQVGNIDTLLTDLNSGGGVE